MASEQQHNAQAMFNLGYMHEQGLGMKKDWHLAKRCYDLAAETSVDAKVPVALALLKLSVMFKFETLRDVSISVLLMQSQKKLKYYNPNYSNIFQSPFNQNIASNWDLYLITFLTIFFGMVFYFRRPPVPEAEDAPRHAQQHVQNHNQPEPQADDPIINNNNNQQ